MSRQAISKEALQNAQQFPEKLQPLFLPKRYKILHGGRGGAKSWGIARALLVLGAGKKLRILCTREVQKSIKDSVHKLLSDQVEMLGLGKFYNILETKIVGVNGTEFTFAGLSSQTVESVKSYEGVDKVWIEEGQTVKKRSWDILIPTVRKPDSEIWVSLNPELDTDDTYIRFIETPHPDSVVIQINHDDNPWFPEVLEKERLHCYNTSRDDYDNIWEGKCRRSVAGAIYAGEVESWHINGNLTNVPYDPRLKVHVVWDLGWNDAMTLIFVQKDVSSARIINYMEESHKKLSWYVERIKELDYNIGTMYLPHDGTHEDFKTGQSAQEILEASGFTVEITPNIGIEDGIKATREVFPRIYMDEAKCERLKVCLKRYKRRLHERTQEPMGPLHDEFCHGADGFRYTALNLDQMSNGGNEVMTKMPAPSNWRAR